MILTSKFNGRCTHCGGPYTMGDRIDYTHGVRGAKHAYCTEAGQAAIATIATSRAVDATIDIPCPDGLAYLPYQRAGIAYALAHNCRCIIADEMGLGKTIQAIGAINASPEVKRVLIVCPASLRLNWKRELGRWLAKPIVGDVVIVSYEGLKKLSKSTAFDLIIFDEAHYVKNPKSARSKLALEFSRLCSRVLLLTGTPILNKPIDLWPLLQIVAPEEWDPAGTVKGKTLPAGHGAGFFRFAKRFCDAHQEKVSRTKTVWVFDGASNLEELNERLRMTCMVRRLKADVLTELPPKRRQVIELDTGVEEEEAWADLGDNFETVEKNLKALPDFERFSAARHEAGIAKVPFAVEHLRDALESSAKIVVFAHHKDVVQALYEELEEFGVLRVTGDETQEARFAAVEAFQSDPSARLIIGTIGAMSTGHTLTASAHVVFVERSWVPSELSQAEDRCHRIGQRESVLVQHLVDNGSLDAHMTRLITEKQNIADMALDSRSLAMPEGGIPSAIAPSVPAVRLYQGTPQELDEAASAAEIARIHAALRYLAERCDDAVKEDGRGFNALDTNIGKSLARCERLSAKQTELGARLIHKYMRQLEGMKS